MTMTSKSKKRLLIIAFVIVVVLYTLNRAARSLAISTTTLTARAVLMTKFYGAPANLSDVQLETLLARLDDAARVKKYIFRYYNSSFLKPGSTQWCGNCEMTYDREMIHHPQTKAVVIDFQIFNKVFRQITNRRTDQLYVWLTQESPAALRYRRMTLESETKFKFNLTGTYRRDSGIYSPYGRISEILRVKRKLGVHRNITNILNKKTKLAVAAISNCDTTTGATTRLSIIHKMKSLGLEVDTYGGCFGNRVKESRQDFIKRLGKYKFFLAFENAFHCRDYITEKFLNGGHEAGTVPVVLGATKADYEAVAPKESFIFVEDFSSLSSLVNYLNFLDKHDDEYLKYFRWLKTGYSALPKSKGVTKFCQLCRMLHGINVEGAVNLDYKTTSMETPPKMFTDEVAPRTVQNLAEWFYGTENKDCFKRNVPSITRMLL